MPTPLENKSTPEEIKNRFDHDVERFSNLESGQQSTVDAPLVMELIARAAVESTSVIRHVLDIGCGAGNSTLKLLKYAGPFECDLIDLSLPMLEKARERIGVVSKRPIHTFQCDIRSLDLPEEHYDVILAAAVFHHLRDDQDWERVFEKLFRITAPGGSIWISDLISHESDGVQSMMWARYGEYLQSLGGEDYQQKVFAYVDKEDSPRPVTYQLNLLREVGFDCTELLHKNSCFAAFGAMKFRKS